MQVNIYVSVDSNVQKKNKKQYGYVLECKSERGAPITRTGFGSAEASYHKTTLTALVEALKRFIRPSEILIRTEDEFVSNMIENNLKTWESNGFLNAKGKPIANAEEWQQLAKLLKAHKITVTAGHHEYSNWLREEIRRKK